GDWEELATFVSDIAPTSFMIHAVSTNADQTEGRDQRIVRTVDLLAAGTDDATDPVPAVVRSNVLNPDLSGPETPTGLSVDGMASFSGGAVLMINMGTHPSHAWVTVDTDPAADQGVLI